MVNLNSLVLIMVIMILFYFRIYTKIIDIEGTETLVLPPTMYHRPTMHHLLLHHVDYEDADMHHRAPHYATTSYPLTRRSNGSASITPQKQNNFDKQRWWGNSQ